MKKLRVVRFFSLSIFESEREKKTKDVNQKLTAEIFKN